MFSAREAIGVWSGGFGSATMPESSPVERNAQSVSRVSARQLGQLKPSLKLRRTSVEKRLVDERAGRNFGDEVRVGLGDTALSRSAYCILAKRWKLSTKTAFVGIGQYSYLDRLNKQYSKVLKGALVFVNQGNRLHTGTDAKSIDIKPNGMSTIQVGIDLT